MSTRQIGEVLGVSNATVSRDAAVADVTEPGPEAGKDRAPEADAVADVTAPEPEPAAPDAGVVPGSDPPRRFVEVRPGPASWSEGSEAFPLRRLAAADGPARPPAGSGAPWSRSGG